MPRRITTPIVRSALLFFLVACSPQAPTAAIFTATPPPPATETFPTAVLPAAPTGTPTTVPTLPPALARPQYAIDLQLNFTAKAASVNQTIVYPNWSGETLNSLVFAVIPNLWSGGFSLKSLAIDGQPIADYTIQTQRLEVPLPQPLPPSGTITISMDYSLILPSMQAYQNSENDIRPQIYGYSERQVNFVDWYPFIVPYNPGEGWILHNPWFYGEHLMYDTADFDVRVTFTDGANPKVAASGVEVESQTDVPLGEPVSRRYNLQAARTFALSMSDHYKVAQQTVGDVTIYSYYFGLYDAPGEAMLRTTVEASQLFGERFGPYRHKTLSAVQGDFNDGMEFSGLYFISRDFFNLYDGTPRNYLVAISAHETAHQWWFDAVANDQALEPWLDEALCTYSEVIYYEAIHPEAVDWWWNFRYFEFEPGGHVDTAIYDGGGYRPYLNKVYLLGARFFQDLRARLGDEIFFAFLRDYYNQSTGERVTGADFFRVFRENTAADITDLLSTYFKNTY
ncbi:MAG: M1 family metallopeptidase [Chloroflexota bacterium]|nr:M1 family metallopeptidase [Chloroflexota bacterium]